MPVYSTIVTPLKSTVSSIGISSRIVLKSRASIVPVSVSSVVPASSYAVKAVDKPPAETTRFFGGCTPVFLTVI